MEGFLSYMRMLKLHCKFIHARLKFYFTRFLSKTSINEVQTVGLRTVPIPARTGSWQQRCEPCLLRCNYISLFTYFLGNNQDIKFLISYSANTM